MLADLAVDRASDPNFAARDRWNPDEEEEEEDDGGELNIIDRSASIISGYSAFPFFAFRLSRRSGYSEGMPSGMLYDRSRRGLFGISPFGFLG
jgi:hypothetical protein